MVYEVVHEIVSALPYVDFSESLKTDAVVALENILIWKDKNTAQMSNIWNDIDTWNKNHQGHSSLHQIQEILVQLQYIQVVYAPMIHW